MSQNDFKIEDGTGEVVLNDINSALQALATNSRGDVAPHIFGQSYPSQFFADTANINCLSEMVLQLHIIV